MASRVYPVLRQYADDHSPVAKTAEHLGVSTRTVQRAIEELCTAGLLIKPTGFVFPAMSQCDILGGTEPISAPLSPAGTRLSTSTFTNLLSQRTDQLTHQECHEIVERLVKYRHLHRSSYRKREFILYPRARVVWMESARYLLEEDGLELDEVLTLMDYAFTIEKWRSRIRTVYHLRRNYPRLLQEYRRSQVADIPHEQWS